MHPGHGPAKPVTRAAVRRRRRTQVPQEVRAAAEGLADQVDRLVRELGDRAVADPGARRAPVVAAYLSLPGEPGTGPLRARLRAAGATVLLPWLQDDAGLDWVVDTGQDPGREAGDGGLAARTRPSGRRLGADAVATAALVLVPALAVDRAGTRLGQGGGSYDRALARLGAPVRPLVLAVVHEDEVLPAGALPVEAHDVAVDGVLTPAGVSLFRGAGEAVRARPPRRPPG